jgi:hypothetical protein
MDLGKTMFLIRIAYWLGIGADALWAVALLFPPLFFTLTGTPDFDPDLQVKLIMGVGGSLMTGWTLLLIWALRRPIERRVVILLTAFPVAFGMFVVASIGFLAGSAANAWIMAKTLLLIVTMVTSYVLADRIAAQTAPAVDPEPS